MSKASHQPLDRPHDSCRDKNLTLPVCLGLTLLVMLMYAQVGWHEFVSYDDPKYVYENPHVTTGLTASNARWAFEIHGLSMWIPLTWLSHQALWEVFGDRAAGHHLVNVLLHAANVLLLFGVLKRMTTTLWSSALVAALFAIHPLHVESVAWVTERKDVLCGLFWMLTLWAYWCFTSQGGLWRYLLVVFSYTLAVMAKPLAVTLPCVLVLLDYWPLGRLKLGQMTPIIGNEKDWISSVQHRPSSRVGLVLLEKTPLLGIAALASYLTILCQLETGAISSLETLPLPTRLANTTISYAAYLRKFLWPDDLAFFYPYPKLLASWQLLTAVALLFFITMAVTWQGRRRPYLLVGWLWYVGVMVPMSGLVQGGSHSMADRFAYLPLVGVYAASAFGLNELVRKLPKIKWPLIYSISVALLILLPVSWLQIGTWRNSLVLYDQALRVTTENYIAHSNLGSALEALGRSEKALAHFQEALQIKPEFAEARNGMGSALQSLGRPEEALAHHQEALQIKPDFAEARNNIGSALQAMGRPEEAIAHFQEALQMKPEFAEARNGLGNALQALGRLEEALAHYQEALQIKPNLAEAHNNMGSALQNLGRPEEALAHYQEALQIKTDFAGVHFNWGIALEGLGRPEEALAHYQEALRIKPDDAETYFKCGAIYEQLGKHELAVKNFDKAIELKPDYAMAYYNRGGIYRGVGDYEQTVGDYSMAIKLKADFVQAYFNRGIVFAQLRKWELALRDFNKLIELNPNDAGAYSNRGNLYATAGNFGLAVNDYTMAIKLNPDYSQAYNNLAWLLATCPDEQYRDGEKAVSAARRLCELLGWDDSSVLEILSASYAQSGRFAEAVKWQTKAIELAPAGSKAELQARLRLYKAGKPYRKKERN